MANLTASWNTNQLCAGSLPCISTTYQYMYISLIIIKEWDDLKAESTAKLPSLIIIGIEEK